MAADTDDSFRRRILKLHPWLPFVLPLLMFSLAGQLEVSDPAATTCFGLVRHEHYPIVYSVKILLTTIALAFVWPAYRVFPFRVSFFGVGVGVFGIVVWIGMVHLGLEKMLPLDWLTDQGARVAYNPLSELKHSPRLAIAFLAVRFFGLAVVIAVAEEMFLRGFLMRCVENPDHWTTLPIGQVGRTAIIVGTVFPMLTHPAELFAALAWFSLVTWLMLKTRNIWDCIVAHMITNLLLGVYVLTTGDWQRW